MDELTKRRLAHNEELFRQVNEAREESTAPDADLTLVCECSDRACTGRITISSADYRRIRDSERKFIVLPGHEISEIERIVDDRGAFEVVEKDAA